MRQKTCSDQLSMKVMQRRFVPMILVACSSAGTSAHGEFDTKTAKPCPNSYELRPALAVSEHLTEGVAIVEVRVNGNTIHLGTGMLNVPPLGHTDPALTDDHRPASLSNRCGC